MQFGDARLSSGGGAISRTALLARARAIDEPTRPPDQASDRRERSRHNAASRRFPQELDSATTAAGFCCRCSRSALGRP
jgi:hypothetical protein